MKKRGGKGDNRPSSYSHLGESVWGELDIGVEESGGGGGYAHGRL